MPELNHLPPTADPEQITRALREDGYVIIDNLVPASHMDRVAEELAPYIEDTAFGADDFLGVKTRRTGSLIARSPAARELVAHPTVLAVAGDYLSHASKFQLHLTQVISTAPDHPPRPSIATNWHGTSSRSRPTTRCSATRCGR
ncbi:phytanoyl-CoA dioxygenase family protein [Mycolicibacterium sp. J2]|nr:phytanoyl-CoA dioxygenase family protein [Mycolicibacterium sp. J2]MCX2715814.1 phytanoyl-CoA dioxygenase family protein [Mycolicibacterium sp. J2]